MKSLEAECRAMFNHICLVNDCQVKRLIGYGEDEHDCYYIMRDLHGEIVWHTMVGPCSTLKGVYDRYDIMDNKFAINSCPPETAFISEKRDETR